MITINGNNDPYDFAGCMWDRAAGMHYAVDDNLDDNETDQTEVEVEAQAARDRQDHEELLREAHRRP